MIKFLSFVMTLALLSVTNIFADQITLKNGDRLTGKVIKQDDEKIILQTEFAGEITISKTNVEKILLETTYTKETKAEKDVEEKVADSDETATTKEKEADATVPSASASFPALGFVNGWDGAANIGFSLTGGNSKTSTLTAGIRAEKSSEQDKWTTYLNTLCRAFL